MKALLFTFGSALILISCSPCSRIQNKIQKLERKAYIQGCVEKLDTIYDTVYLPRVEYREVLKVDTMAIHDTLIKYVPKEVVAYVIRSFDTDTSRFDTLGISCFALINDGSLIHDFGIYSSAIPVKIIPVRTLNFKDTSSKWKRIAYVFIGISIVLLILLILLFKLK